MPSERLPIFVEPASGPSAPPTAPTWAGLPVRETTAAPAPAPRFFIETWGCQMNEYDTGKIAGLLEAEGYEPAPDPAAADIILLNTCSVRERAEHKMLSAIGRYAKLRRNHPGLLIGVGGCVAQQMGEDLLRRSRHVDLVFGPDRIAGLPELLLTARGHRFADTAWRGRHSHQFLPANILPAATGPTAYVTIMKGCDKFCSFCIVPFVRGREFSRPPAEVLDECRLLAARGVREVTLLGQNVTSYRPTPGGPPGFDTLLAAVNGIQGIERIRFTTAHPHDVTASLAAAFRDLPKLCEYFHLPVQSGSDRILAAMNRGYTRDEYLRKIDLIRRHRPDIAFSTDIITGFPGETDADFAATLSLIADIGFTNVFAFAYSPRPGTAALELTAPAVPAATAAARLQEVLALAQNLAARQHQQILGTFQEILVEGPSKLDAQWLTGRTRTNRIVHIPTGSAPPGTLTPVRITAVHAFSLRGEPVPPPRSNVRAPAASP